MAKFHYYILSIMLVSVMIVWAHEKSSCESLYDGADGILSCLEVDTALAALEDRPDFGESGWQSVKGLLQVEEEVIEHLVNDMTDLHFDYILTTRELLLDKALPSVFDIREKMVDAAAVFAAEKAKVLQKLRDFGHQNIHGVLSDKQRCKFLRYMSEMLGIYYYRVDEIQSRKR